MLLKDCTGFTCAVLRRHFKGKEQVKSGLRFVIAQIGRFESVRGCRKTATGNILRDNGIKQFNAVLTFWW